MNHSGQAGPTEDLLDQKLRPTIQDTTSAFHKWPDANPFGASDAARARNMKSLLKTGAEAIAAFEAIYPGARWVVIGRDMDFFGDILEAYYRQKGQGDRVVRLGMSGTTLNEELYGLQVVRGVQVEGINKKFQRNIYGFLTSHGLDLGKIDKAAPFILLDSTSYGENSQTRTLLSAGYYEYMQNGGDPKNLLRKFNAINVDTSSVDKGRTNRPLKPRFDGKNFNLNQFFSEQEKQVGRQGPSKILSVEARPLVYHSPLWYRETWSPFYRDPKTKEVYTVPSEPTGIPERTRILQEQYEIVKGVSSRDFEDRVRKEGKRLLPFTCGEKFRNLR